MVDTPIRPQASRTSSLSSSQEHEAILDINVQQAGRSPINLAAQQSAQSLREAARPTQPTRSRSPSKRNVLRKKNRPESSLAENDAPPPQTTRRHSLFVPRISSPLNPTPTNSDSDSAACSREAIEEANDEAAKPDARPIHHHRSSPALRLTVPELRLPEQLDTKPPIAVRRLRTPRSVRELGSDYTRYFNPFPAPHRTRNVLLRQRSASLLMTGAADSLLPPDVSRRLSNPFTDNKRLSNPFESPLDPESGGDQRSQVSPTEDSQAVSVDGTLQSRPGTPMYVRDDPEKSDFFQYIDDRLGAPEYAFPLITDQKEDDDDLHMPLWDDDILLKPKLKDHFTRENIVSTFGLLLMVTGLLFVFVVLPVISYTGTSILDYYYETPLSQMPHADPSQPWAHVNDRKYPLLKNIRQGLIDPDTPDYAKTRKSVEGETFVLVFSDEFNKKNRTFYPGDDPYWSGFDGWYAATNDLEWYDPDAVNTGDGTLLVQLDQIPNNGFDFRSGMLNSWNQLCFKGGIFEVSMSLPGPAGVHGLWPGVWTMGNLGRPGYLASTDGLWPYTYNECDVGITPNQSSQDGISYLPGQRLSVCTCSGEDHPSPGKGRGAPEIDIAEISADWTGEGIGLATQSFQVAPFDIWYYPNYDFMQNPNYNMSLVNTYTGGPYQQAVSTTTILNNNWYDGNEYQKFAFEYSPGGDKSAYIAWTIADEEMMRFDGRAVGPNGNIGQRLISEEPMSMILNLGISSSWTFVEWSKLRFPTVLRIDYVRWYQRESEQMVTCDPPGFETTEYIANHPAAYRNRNFTKWEDAGYAWPRNTLVDDCSA